MNVVHIFTDIKAIPASGMQSGRSSVAVICDLPQGKKLFAELSMANFEGVAAAFRGAEQWAKECEGTN